MRPSPVLGAGGGANSHHVISIEGVGSSFWPPALSPFFCDHLNPSMCRGARCRRLSSHVYCAVGQGSQAALPKFLSWGSASPVGLALACSVSLRRSPVHFCQSACVVVLTVAGSVRTHCRRGARLHQFASPQRAPSLRGEALCSLAKQFVGGARLRWLSSHATRLCGLSGTVCRSRVVSGMGGGDFSTTPRHGGSPPNGGGLDHPTVNQCQAELSFCLSLVKGGFP